MAAYSFRERGVREFFPSVLILCALFSRAISVPTADFCETVVAKLLQCPTVPTVDAVDLEKYQGRWYQIGVTAQFELQFVGNQGAQCVYANYTSLGLVDGKPAVKVVNRGLQFTSVVRQSQVLGVTKFSYAAGIGVRYLCQFLVAADPLASLAPFATEASSLLTSPAATHAQFTLNPSATTLGGSQAGGPPDVMKLAADVMFSGLVKDLEQMFGQMPGLKPVLEIFMNSARSAGPVASLAQQANVGPASLQAIVAKIRAAMAAASPALGQAFLSGIPSSTASLVQALQSTASVSSSLCNDDKAIIAAKTAVILQAVARSSLLASSIFESLGLIQLSASVLSGSTLPNPYSTPKTVAAINTQSGLIAAQADALDLERTRILEATMAIAALSGIKDAQVTAIAGGLSVVASSYGPLALSILRTSAFAQAVTLVANTVLPEAPTMRMVDVEGQAFQTTASEPGSLKLFLNAFGPSTSANQYNIIRLTGNATTGYETSIVFDCQSSLFQAFVPQNVFFLIARTPTVPKAVVDEALAFAAQKGIFIGGDNIFIQTNENPNLCQPSYSLP